MISCLVRGVLAISNTASYSSAMPSLRDGAKSLFSLLRMGVAGGMVCIILGLAPFAAAQDVHHELAAADTDGHEHSDTDLCRWVQQHAFGSIELGVPSLSGWEIVGQCECPSPVILLPLESSALEPSRAPPQI